MVGGGGGGGGGGGDYGGGGGGGGAYDEGAYDEGAYEGSYEGAYDEGGETTDDNGGEGLSDELFYEDEGDLLAADDSEQQPYDGTGDGGDESVWEDTVASSGNENVGGNRFFLLGFDEKDIVKMIPGVLSAAGGAFADGGGGGGGKGGGAEAVRLQEEARRREEAERKADKLQTGLYVAGGIGFVTLLGLLLRKG
jgi:hypothetical protein